MGSPDREQVPRCPPGRVRSTGRGVGRHPYRGQTVGSIGMYPCVGQLQGEVEFQV